MPTSGTDLKVERVRSNVSLKDLAARMVLSRQSVWVLERSAVVEPSRARAYRDALREITENSADEAIA